MRTSRPEPHTLSGAYALDALTGADRARFERHLARCSACEREIRGLRETAARLAAAAAAGPPAGLAGRTLTAAAATRQLPPLTRDMAARWPARRRARQARPASPAGLARRPWTPRPALALAAAVLILAAILAAAVRTTGHQLAAGQARSQQIAAILTAPDATMLTARVTGGGTATVVMSSRGHALVFAAAALPPLPSSRRYELWLIRAGRDKAAGMLPAASRGITGPALASGLTAAERLGLSVEPAAGSPQPTAAMILVLAL